MTQEEAWKTIAIEIQKLKVNVREFLKLNADKEREIARLKRWRFDFWSFQAGVLASVVIRIIIDLVKLYVQ